MRTDLVMVATLAACSGTARKTPPPKRVRVQVLDVNGEPAAGAFVLATRGEPVREELVRADAAGNVDLEAQPAALAVASADGFLFVPSWTPTANDQLTLGGDCVHVQGHVVDAAGEPVLSEVVVRLRRESEQTGDSFFLASTGGTVTGCVPPARYTMTGDGGAFVGQEGWPEISAASGTLPDYRVWERRAVVAPAPAEATEWLRGHAVPDMGLDALLPTLEGARIIGCGEANHGSAEPYRMRRALLDVAVSRLGSRVLLIEAGLGESLALDRYLQTGDGDLAALIAAMHMWIWDTEEFTAVLRSIRERNVGLPPEARVHVVGVDIQYSDGAWAVVRERVPTDHRAQLDFLAGRDAGEKFLAMSAAERENVTAVVEEVARSAKEGAEDWWAARALRMFLEYVVVTGETESFVLRDQMMADNALAVIAHTAGGPALLWAHNAHVAREPYFAMTTMGMLLAKDLGARYVPIAFLTGAGALRAWDLRAEIGVVEHSLATPPPYSVEGLLSRVDLPAFYVDVRAAGPVRAWLGIPRYDREVGAQWPGDGQELVLRDVVKAFDVIGFAQRSNATHPTATGVRKVDH